MEWNNTVYYANYDNFKIGSENENFLLQVSGYSGNAGDSLSAQHNGRSFSTFDSDNDEYNGHCAEKNGAGWWYSACGTSGLNGRYFLTPKLKANSDGSFRTGILWHSVYDTFL